MLMCRACHQEIPEDDVYLHGSALWHTVEVPGHDGPGSDPESWFMTYERCGPVVEVPDERGGE